MATNDFVIDLVQKLDEDNIEYLVITIQKGKEEHKSSAHYNIKTVDGADMIVTTIDEVFKNVGDGEDLDGDSDLDHHEGAD